MSKWNQGSTRTYWWADGQGTLNELRLGLAHAFQGTVGRELNLELDLEGGDEKKG